MRAVIEVQDCRDCPYRRTYRGHGECAEGCWHPEAVGRWDNILWGCQEEFKAIPAWCPLLENENEA